MEGSLNLPPWVDLPDLVTELILEHLPLPDYIRFAAVCRKWGSIQKDHRLRHSPHPPPMGVHPLPWLVPRRILSFGTGFDCYSPLEKRLHHLRFPTTPTFQSSTICLACCRGWLLMLDLDEDDGHDPFDDYSVRPFPTSPFLFNPLTGVVISLPMLSIIPGDLNFTTLSSPPYDPDCTILLVDGGSVSMCRVNDPGDVWTMVVKMGVEIEKWIDSAVYRGGKFYCISRKGVLSVIDRVLSTPTLMPLTMDVSALDKRDRDRCRLVEFDGELLLVMEVYDWDDKLEGFEVFRADLSGEKWVKKMDMLTNHVLFLNDCCSFSLLASDVGCKKNCIYYTHEHGPYVWSVFDLDTLNWIHEEAVRRDMFWWRHWFLPTLG